MIKNVLALLALVTLSGCAAVNYTYGGQKFANKESLHQAVDADVTNMLATVSPLPAPLSRKKLIVAMPSEASFIGLSSRRFVEMQGHQPSAQAQEIMENLSRSNFKTIKVFADAVRKKNIYASMQFIEMQSLTGSVAASPDTDALYLVNPSGNSAQWYFVSEKQGKQIFAHDRSSPTGAGMVNAFIEAVQAQAIRD